VQVQVQVQQKRPLYEWVTFQARLYFGVLGCECVEENKFHGNIKGAYYSRRSFVSKKNNHYTEALLRFT
jgi:hypothetical protein